MPNEWTVYQICKQFGKLPHEVEAMPYEDYLAVLVCMDFDRKLSKPVRRN